MRLKLGVLFIGAFGALLIGWSFLRSKSQLPQESQRKIAAVPVSKDLDDVGSQTANQVVKDQLVQSSVIPNKVTENRKLPQPEALQSFKIIQAKVFKSDEDQKKLKKIIMDSHYLLQLGEYLRDLQNLNQDDFKKNQNAVIDLLVEALKSGDSPSAEQAILEIVKDAQIEDEKIALKEREVLGGIKAELLYQSSSIRPQLSQQFDLVLPGPVSQKIWKNVQNQQADNLELSRAELVGRQEANRR